MLCNWWFGSSKSQSKRTKHVTVLAIRFPFSLWRWEAPSLYHSIPQLLSAGRRCLLNQACFVANNPPGCPRSIPLQWSCCLQPLAFVDVALTFKHPIMQSPVIHVTSHRLTLGEALPWQFVRRCCVTICISPRNEVSHAFPYLQPF